MSPTIRISIAKNI